MAYKKKKRYIPRKKQSTPPEGFLCFWKLVKDVSRKGRLSFTIQDKEGNLTVVDIENGEMTINKNPMNDAAALSFISRTKKDFERLFMAAAKKYDEDNRLMGDIYIASVADASFMAGKMAVMRFVVNGKSIRLDISRVGENIDFMMDGKRISEEEGKTFIRRYYGQFITGYKGAIKGLASEDEIPSSAPKKKSPEQMKSHITEDGKLIVDVSGFLDSGKERAKKKKAGMTLGEQILRDKQLGYVNED